MVLGLHPLNQKGHDEENLSVATNMNYTRLFQQLHELWQLRLSPYTQNSHDEENLSFATYMNYTRLFQQLPDNSPLTGAQTFVQLLAKCNPYMPQR